MREIKFRAWSTKRKCYEYNVGVNDSKPVRYGYQWFSTDNDVYHGDLEQFTGLRDKNGKEIYEGDIINQWVDLGPGGEGLYISQVFITNFGPTIMKWEYDEDGYMPEVMGNIHENHNLLD